MVESLLKTDTIPKQLRTFIHDKAEGNPFYLEEVVNSLIETDTLIRDNGSWKLTRSLTEKDIPSTVQGVVSARLDRLERETKRILQEASVIGRSFLYEILKRISDLKDCIDKGLTSLEHLDLIKTRSLQPELEYIFKHALTQEVVYNGLLLKERRLIHEKIGQVMEELFHDHLPDFYETLSYHYSQSDNLQKAYEYLKLSGDKAAKSYANQEAIRFYREAIRMLDAQPESLENKKEKLKLYLMMRIPYQFLSYPEGCLEVFQNGEKLAQELENDESLAQIHIALSTYDTIAGGNPSLGLEYAEKCFNSAEKIKDFGLIAQSASRISVAHWMAGDVTKIVDIGSRTIPLLEEHHLEKDFFGMGYSMYTEICAFYGSSLGWMGRFKEGTDIFEKAFQNARETNDKYHMGITSTLRSTLPYWAGYGDSMITHAQKAVNIFEEAEISLGIDVAWLMLGAGYYLRGEYDKALGPGEKGLTLAKELGMPYMVSWSYWHVAMMLRATGDLKRAGEYAEEALRISQECNSKGCKGVARVLLGCISRDMTSIFIEDVEYKIKEGISLLEDCKLKPLSACGYLHLGEFFASADRKEEALEYLRKAEALYQEMEVTPESYWLVRTQNSLRKLESDVCTTH